MTEDVSTTNPISIDGREALTELVERQTIVLADFYADWCGPCKMLEPTLETIAAETDATVAKIDVDSNQQFAASAGVQGVPTLLLFVDGEPIERLVGLQSEDQLRELVESHA